MVKCYVSLPWQQQPSRPTLITLIVCSHPYAAGKHEHNPKRTKINGSGGDGNLSFPVHPSFKRIRSNNLPAYQASMHLYQHVKTQAEFIAYVPLDETQDKTFGISFRTKPTSDNGIAHILEHSVLSGSKKYPSKDPFLALSKGSLNTFLNAMTYNDRTVYPIASRNKKDYMNLMGVLLRCSIRTEMCRRWWIMGLEARGFLEVWYRRWWRWWSGSYHQGCGL